MTATLIRLLSILALFAPLAASAAGLPPWQFGMTKAEVASYKEFGPYKNFSNGDLETFNGSFHDHKESIQFFFDHGRLRRIGVYLGEGTDSKKAVATFQPAYELLQQDYGKIEVPEMKVTGGGTPPPTVVAVGALANADVTVLILPGEDKCAFRLCWPTSATSRGRGDCRIHRSRCGTCTGSNRR